MKRIISCIIIAAICLSFAGCNKILGIDENCVISKDYSYITYNGEKYIPIDTYKGYFDGCETEIIVKEAKVEGKLAIGKLFFKDMIYMFKNDTKGDILYLWTDYDGSHADYYCKESVYDQVCSELASGEYFTE